MPKKKKDPNAPKRASTAFIFYTKERQPQLKAEHPSWAFGDFGKHIGAEWRGMSDKRKTAYNKMADNDKARYQDEMQDYEPPSDLEDDVPTKKKKKDPNAPKGACTAFMFFSIGRRPQLKVENPDWAFGEFGKQIGAEWREMSDADKGPYGDQANADKQRHDLEMQNYVQGHRHHHDDY